VFFPNISPGQNPLWKFYPTFIFKLECLPAIDKAITKSKSERKPINFKSRNLKTCIHC